MEDREILEKLKKEKTKWENRIYGVGETRIDLMLEDVIRTIQNILKENENLKQAIAINKREYQKVCNENKELEERNTKLCKKLYLCTPEIPQSNHNKYISYADLVEKLADSIPTSLVKEKIEEIEQEDLEIYDTDSEDVKIAKYEQRAILDFSKNLLGKE